MSTALNAYKDDAMSAADAADILAGTANASATSVGELSYSLAAVSAVASGVGMSFRDTNIALGLFANNGLRGSDAGTSLKTMLSNLSPKTDAAYGAFEDLGLITFDATRGMQVLAENGIKPASNSINDVRAALEQFAMKTVGATKYTAKAKKEFANMGAVTGFMNNAFYDSKGNLEDLSVISGALKKSLSSLTAEQRQNALYTMFGSDAIRAGNILYKEGAEGVKNFNKEMSKVTALDVAKEKLNNAKGAVEQFKGAMETLQIAVMTPLLPLIKRAALNFADFVGGLKPEQIKSFGDQVSGAFESVYDKAVSVASFIKNNWPAVKEVIIGATTAVIAYKAAMAGLTVVSVITRLIQSYRQATVTMTAAQWALNIAMDANLFGIIAAAIAGVIAVGVLLYRNWDTIKKKAVELWDRAGILKTGLLALTGPIGLVIAAGVNLYKNWDKVKDTAKSAFSGIGKFIDGMKAKFDGFVSTVKAFDITDYEVGMPKWAGGDGVVHRKSNSHYHGISRVPYDRYPATLHKGERVLTAKENRQYTRATSGGGGITINMGSVTVREEADINRLADKLAARIYQSWDGGA